VAVNIFSADFDKEVPWVKLVANVKVIFVSVAFNVVIFDFGCLVLNIVGFNLVREVVSSVKFNVVKFWVLYAVD